MTARVVLGADAWTVLRRDAAGLRLPPAFDGVPLSAEQAAAAEAALRASDVVPGRGGDLVSGLHPSVRASLLVHLLAPVAVDLVVGTADDPLVARVAVAPELASVLERRGAGPVTLRTLVPDDVASHLAGLLPGLATGARTRTPLVHDAAALVAAEQALADGRADLAGALGALPPEVRQAARLEVTGPRTALALLAVRTGDGWEAASLRGPDLVLRPLDVDTLVTDLAGALAAALVPA